MTGQSTSPKMDDSPTVATSLKIAKRWWRRSLITLGIAVPVLTSAIASGTSALAQNYCVPHPAAEGCNLPRTGPHVTAASISKGRLHLGLTFHKAGRFVAHIKRNPPPEPYGRGWEAGALGLRSANRFRSASIRQDPEPSLSRWEPSLLVNTA